MSRRRVESNNGGFDENDRSLYRVFKNTANLVSQFYAQSINSQKLAFEAGETYAILEMQEWMLGMMREGKIVTVADILGYVQGKIDSLANEMPGQAATGYAGMAAPLSAGMAAPLSAGMTTPLSAGMAAPSTAGMAAPSSAGIAAPSSAGMAEPLFTPQEQSSYLGCLFSPPEQNSAELAARLFAPQEQDVYPDMQTDKM